MTLQSAPTLKQDERARSRLRWLEAGIVVLVLGAVLLMFSRTLADPDLWGHVRYGQDHWETGRVVRADPFSYLSQGQVWVNHEWLAELIFYLAWSGAGNAGLLAVKFAIVFLIVGLGYAHLRRRRVRPSLAAALVIAASFLMVTGLGTVRPHAFTYLLFLLLLLAIDQAEHGRTRWLWGLPPLFALWVNLHGGFLAGIGMLLLWCLARLALLLWRTRRLQALFSPPELAVPGALLASGLVTLLNPYGVGLWAFLLRTATVPRPEITEWVPVSITDVQGAAYLLLVALSAIGLLYSRRRRSPALLALFACAALLPLVAQRHLALFALTMLVVAAEHIGDLWERGSAGPQARRAPDAGAGRLVPWMLGVCCLGAVAMVGLSLPRLGRLDLWVATEPYYPVRAVALLKESGVSGNLAVHFDWGQYAIWHLSPQIRVSMDGRRETVYSEQVYRENLAFIFGQGDWDALLRQYDTHMALVTKKLPVYNLMKLASGWLLAYEDELCALFVREGLPLLAEIQRVDLAALPDSDTQRDFP